MKLVDVKELNRVDLARGISLPDCPGIYFIYTETRVLYVGKASSLRQRWDRGHHRALEMIASGEALSVGWLEMAVSEVDEAERAFIQSLQPILNIQYSGGETKPRSIRLNEENWKWLQELPGRSTNEALTILREQMSSVDPNLMAAKLDEILELVRSQSAHIETLAQRTITHTPAQFPTESLVDNRPKNATCKHCGKSFAGPRYATICPECKSKGHTNTPAECPPCLEASPT